jgi:hypothetical protein
MSEKGQYMLLARGLQWDKGLSAEQIEHAVGRVHAWLDRLTREGKAEGGQPLEHEGAVLSSKKGQPVADGPFAESKEAIAGYFMIRADSLAEAIEIAKGYPMFEYGVTMEVRPVAAECASLSRLKEKAAIA